MKFSAATQLSVGSLGLIWAALLTTRTVSAQNQATCNGLDNMIQQTTLLMCSRNAACDRVDCASGSPLFNSYSLTLTLLSCRDPPGVGAVVQQGTVIEYDDVIDRSMSGVPIGGSNTLSVTLDHLQNPPSIGVQIAIGTAFGPVTVLPYSRIPLDTGSCAVTTTVPSGEVTTYVRPSSVTSSSTVGLVTTAGDGGSPTSTSLIGSSAATTATGFKSTQSSPSTTSTVTAKESLSSIISTRLPITQGPTPTTTPGLNTTCSVLKDTAANAQIFECTSDTTQPCDRIFCSEEIGGKNYDAVIVLLPCSDSPAVRVELSRNNGAVGVNETVDSSREIPVPGPLGFSMVVTVDHFPDALGLQVDGRVFAELYAIIKYTVIPLERTKTCNGNSGDSGETSSATAVATLPIATVLSVITASVLLR